MKISQEVLEVLSALSFDGNMVRIEQQLDRKLYTKVNDVLSACGGKWTRGVKAHVFRDDAEPIISAAINAGEVKTAKDDGFFATPVELASHLVEIAGVKQGHRALEPSAGTGRIVDELIRAGASVLAWEIDAERAASMTGQHVALNVVVGDFMNCPPISPRLDRVVLNPPFCKVGIGDHLDHVRHAYGLLGDGGVLVSVLPSSVTFRQDRRHREFREWFQKRGGEVEPLPEGSFKSSGTMVNTCVLRMRS